MNFRNMWKFRKKKGGSGTYIMISQVKSDWINEQRFIV